MSDAAYWGYAVIGAVALCSLVGWILWNVVDLMRYRAWKRDHEAQR